jgi:hypothetical protein
MTGRFLGRFLAAAPRIFMDPSIEGSSLERAGYLERGIAPFRASDYNVSTGRGRTKEAAAPVRVEDGGRAPSTFQGIA